MSKQSDDLISLRGRDVTLSGVRKRLVPRVPAPLDYTTQLTQQQFADECDLSKVVNQWLKTGDQSIAGNIRRGTPQYIDVSGITDLRDALEVVQTSEQLFASLPSETRRVLGDDPQNLVDAYSRGDVGLLRQCGLLPEAPKQAAPAEPSAAGAAPAGAQGAGA